MFQIFKGIAVGLVMVLAVFAFASSPLLTSAQQSDLVPDGSVVCGGDCPVIGKSDVGTVNQNSLVQIIINVARFLTFVGVGLSVLFMVWGGIRYITAGGSDGSSEGKNTLINATIGLVVSIVAFTVVNVLASLLQGNIAENIIQ